MCHAEVVTVMKMYACVRSGFAVVLGVELRKGVAVEAPAGGGGEGCVQTVVGRGPGLMARIWKRWWGDGLGDQPRFSLRPGMTGPRMGPGGSDSTGLATSVRTIWPSVSLISKVSFLLRIRIFILEVRRVLSPELLLENAAQATTKPQAVNTHCRYTSPFSHKHQAVT